MAVVVSAVVSKSGRTTGGLSVKISGSGFVATPTVTFGGTAATAVVFVSATLLTCTTPAKAAGAVDVKVTNPDTTNGTLVNGFTYYTPASRDDVIQVAINGTVITPRKGSISGSRGRSKTECNFAVDSGTIPSAYQEIRIGLGSIAADDLIFYGNVDLVSQALVAETNISYDVRCVDLSRKANRRRVYKVYASQSTTAIAQDIVTSFTSGFTSVNVQASLTSVAITFAGETVTEALDKLVALASKTGTQHFWYWDNSQDLHLFTSETVTEPDTLNSTNYKTVVGSFKYDKDPSEIRNRIRVKGFGESLPFSTPSGQTVWPCSDTVANGVGASLPSILIPTINGKTLVTTSQFVVGGATGQAQATAAGAAAVVLNGHISATFSGGAWVNIGGTPYLCTVSSANPNDTLSITSSITGGGTLLADVAANAQIVVISSVTVSINTAIPSGTAWNLAAERNNTTSQTNVAAAEGGDGIHEGEISDSTLFTATALNNAGDAELTTYAPMTRNKATYESFDKNSAPRRLCTISNFQGVTDTLYIQQADFREFDYDPLGGNALLPFIFSVTASNDQVTIEQVLKQIHTA